MIIIACFIRLQYAPRSEYANVLSTPKPPFNDILQLRMNVVPNLPLQLLQIYAPKIVDTIPCVSEGCHVTLHVRVTHVRQVVPAYKK